MKDKIKNWLGLNSLGIHELKREVANLKEVVGKEDTEDDEDGYFYPTFARMRLKFADVSTSKSSLHERIRELEDKYKKLSDNFQELDRKFDLLERFLQIELYKTTEEVQVYDWADKKTQEGFRKTLPYEKIKEKNQ